MATSKREKELPVVANGSDDGGGKRQCTRSASTTAMVKEEPEETEKKNACSDKNLSTPQQQPAVTVSPTKQNDENDALPTTSMELSKVLCRIVDTDHFSREEALVTLKKLCKWVDTKDENFLKRFHYQGGIIKVLDFLHATMNDINCTGNIRSNCIGSAARVIGGVAISGVGAADNNDSIHKIFALALDYGGLDVLINASEEYIGGNNAGELNALSNVWYAFYRIYVLRLENQSIMKEKANAVFETGIDVLSHLKTVSIDNESSAVLGIIFNTLDAIVGKGYVTKNFIQNNNCISKCLDVFKKNDGTWKDDNGILPRPVERAILFLDHCRRKRNLLNGDSDYELILSFYAFALKTFGTDKVIRASGIRFLSASFSFVRNKNIIKRSKCMEALGFLLGSNAIDEDEKREVGALIGTIATL